jgi:hypothetical protein
MKIISVFLMVFALAISAIPVHQEYDELVSSQVVDSFTSGNRLIKRGGSLSIPYVLTREEVLKDIYATAATRARERLDRKDQLKEIYSIAAEAAKAKFESQKR